MKTGERVELEDSILDKSTRLFAYAILALLVYPISVFGPAGVHWVDAAIIATLVVREVDMVRALRQLKRSYAGASLRKTLSRHFASALFALAVLIYALIGVALRWRFAWVPVFIVFVINVIESFTFAAPPTGGEGR
jgi:hypothetical protein